MSEGIEWPSTNSLGGKLIQHKYPDYSHAVSLVSFYVTTFSGFHLSFWPIAMQIFPLKLATHPYLLYYTETFSFSCL